MLCRSNVVLRQRPNNLRVLGNRTNLVASSTRSNTCLVSPFGFPQYCLEQRRTTFRDAGKCYLPWTRYRKAIGLLVIHVFLAMNPLQHWRQTMPLDRTQTRVRTGLVCSLLLNRHNLSEQQSTRKYHAIHASDISVKHLPRRYYSHHAKQSYHSRHQN